MRDVIVAASIAVLSSCAGALAQQQPVVSCGGVVIAEAVVERIVDGRTLVLQNGHEVRLAAIEVPPLGVSADSAPAAVASRDALVALAGGDEVVLRQAESGADRYRRILAYAYVLRDGEEIFVQGEMISAGVARVGDYVGNRTCAADLHAREQAARAAKLGLWADSYYQVLDAENPADVLAHRGRFALVEGKVISVRQSGPTIYVNFGRRWSEDFAVTVQKRSERNFAAAGVELERLEGKRLRVRGWIEQRGSSPSIEALHPEQIELADLK